MVTSLSLCLAEQREWSCQTDRLPTCHRVGRKVRGCPRVKLWLSGNFLACTKLPGRRPRIRCFLSHMGANSTTEALAADVFGKVGTRRNRLKKEAVGTRLATEEPGKPR